MENIINIKDVITNKSFYHNDNFIYISKKLDTVEKDYNVTINYNLSVNYKDKESIDFDYNYKLDLPNSVLYIKNSKKHKYNNSFRRALINSRKKRCRKNNLHKITLQTVRSNGRRNTCKWSEYKRHRILQIS
jgi:hypothetical protein